VRIVDDAGADVPPGSGAAGEVVVRGPTLFPGYQPRAAASDGADAAVQGGDAWLEPGGWFRTGDLAIDQGDGYMLVVDRKKDMVRRGAVLGWGEGLWTKQKRTRCSVGRGRAKA
jgi:long-chain acyl-CoA synthetase